MLETGQQLLLPAEASFLVNTDFQVTQIKELYFAAQTLCWFFNNFLILFRFHTVCLQNWFNSRRAKWPLLFPRLPDSRCRLADVDRALREQYPESECCRP